MSNSGAVLELTGDQPKITFGPSATPTRCVLGPPSPRIRYCRVLEGRNALPFVFVYFVITRVSTVDTESREVARTPMAGRPLYCTFTLNCALQHLKLFGLGRGRDGAKEHNAHGSAGSGGFVTRGGWTPRARKPFLLRTCMHVRMHV